MPFPDVIADLRWHLKCFAQDGADGLVFTSPAGTPLRHSNFYRRIWLKAVEAAGLSGAHFHDLRHTGNALTEGRGVAPDASFPGLREDGAVRTAGFRAAA